MSELSSAHVSPATDCATAGGARGPGAGHHRNGVHEIKRELATDMADLALAVAAGAGVGLFGGGAACYGGMFAGSGSSIAGLFTGPATIGDDCLYWLGSFSAVNVYGAAMSAEIDEARLLVALNLAHERHAASHATGEVGENERCSSFAAIQPLMSAGIGAVD